MKKSARKHSKPPASAQPPTARLSMRDVQASADELIRFHRLFHPIFQRREQREWSALYLGGQLSTLERKTIEPIVAAFRGADPNAMRGLQRFMSQETWLATTMILHLQDLVAEWLGDPKGVAIVDGSGFPKQGQSSVAVARQYCGAVGKVANSQEGVFLVYASRYSAAFVDERLYVHETWFSDAARTRWQQCGIPDNLRFQTEPELALDMLRGLVNRGILPFRWIVADAHFGAVPAFLDGVTALGKWYLIEVPCDTRAWLHTPPIEPPGCGVLGKPRTQPRVSRHAPRPSQLRELAAQLPKSAWTRYCIKEGSKGPLIADFAFLRVTTIRNELPGPRVWIIFRRRVGNDPESKFYLSNAPTTCPRAEFVRVCGLRWPVETTLEEGKGEVGMDQYETRGWVSWHHQMAHAFMAHLFLVRLCLVFKKKSCLDRRTSASLDRIRLGRRARRSSRHYLSHSLSSATKLCCIPFPSPTPTRKKALTFTWASTVIKVSESYEVSE